MGWGDALKAAGDKATAAGRAAADAVASGRDWVGQKSHETGQWLDAKRQQAADWAAQKKQAAAEWAAQQRDAARQSARESLRTKSDQAYDWLGEKAEARRVKQAAEAQKKAFPAGQKAGSACQGCPAPSGTGLAHDGWLMSPSCSGAGPKCACKPTPPGKDALAQARGKAEMSASDCCKQRRPRGQPPRDIIYVNGIQTDAAAHCETLKAIARQTCGRVVGVFNATAGTSKSGFAADAAQTSQDRRLIKQANGTKPPPTGDGRNPAVDTRQRAVTGELKAGRPPEIWAHSQGGAITSLALHGARADRAIATGASDPLAGIKVKSMGAAAPKWPDGPRYEHLVHVNDFTPSNFGLGFDPAGDAAAAGRAARVVRFGGDPTSTDPFTRAPKLDWLPEGTANHGVEDTYLRMEKQLHGGCT